MPSNVPTKVTIQSIASKVLPANIYGLASEFLG